MFRPEGLFLDLKRPLVKGLGPGVLPLIVVEPREVVEAGSHGRVLRPEGLFLDLKRPLVKGLSLRVLALVAVEQR